MRIGIIGAGNIGQAAAFRLASAGHDVVISNSRGPETLAEIEEEMGQAVTAGTVEHAAQTGDAVIVATPLAAVSSLPASDLDGKVVLDANNYYPGRDGQITELDDGLGSSEWLAQHLPGAKVVKALNTMMSATLRGAGKPAGASERLGSPVAADDEGAKDLVSGLIDDMGFDPVDAGNLEGGRRQQPGTPVYGAELDAAGVAKALREANG